MRPTRRVQSWVVYALTVRGKPSGINVVCEQAEWDALEGEHPGVHTLVKAGITNEGEAERHARASMPALLNSPRKYRGPPSRPGPGRCRGRPHVRAGRRRLRP
jgi:hypothetical protein